MQITIVDVTGKSFLLEVEASHTVETVKEKVRGIVAPPPKLDLISNGRRLEDERTLSDYNIQMTAIVHLVVSK